MEWELISMVIPAINNQITSRYRDEDGNIILEVGVEELIISQPDGSLVNHKTSDNIQLVCGSSFNPSMSMGAEPVMLLVVCTFCRQDRDHPTHGLCSQAAAARCAKCNRYLCPNHRVDSRFDDQPRCDSCHRRHRVKQTALRIFFRRG